MVEEGETCVALVWHVEGVGVGDSKVGLEWAGLVGHMCTLRTLPHRLASTAPNGKSQEQSASLYTTESSVNCNS